MTALLHERIVLFTMQELSGISASPGIAIGNAFLYLDDHPTVPRYEIADADVPAELERFRSAVGRAETELLELKARAQEEVSNDHIAILDAHLMMLQDEEFSLQIESDIRSTHHNVESVLHSRVQQLISKLNLSTDEHLRSRQSDLRDVLNRVLNHLMYRERISLADLQEEIVLVVHDLMPSDAIAMDKRNVKAIVMDAGGKTSHTAILARAFEIPAVLGLTEITAHVHNGVPLIVDGNHGRVIVEPDQETLQSFVEQQQAWRRHEVQLMGLTELPAETRDGKLVALKANIEVPDEVDAVAAHGADGIGLYRSEFLFLRPGRIPTEDEQFHAYKYVLEAMGEKPVTIRTLDVGGDKMVPGLPGLSERNPILGWRAIRFCLSNQEIFRTQLRALYRASVHGKLAIMFPMISGLEELSEAYEVLLSVQDDLRTRKIAFDENVPVGIMIETPSAAMVSDILARRSHFFSIGTNDLIQYTIAVDRGNEKIAYLYEPFHPGVLRLIHLVIDNAHAQGITAAMCGEMAGDPLATVLLLGLGLDEFSMSSGSIPEVKRIIRDVSLREAEEVVGQATEMKTFKEVDQFLRKLMEERFGLTVY